MKFTNIHQPVALVLLLALDHNHLEHSLVDMRWGDIVLLSLVVRYGG